MTTTRAGRTAALLGVVLTAVTGCGVSATISSAPVSGTLPAAGFGARALSAADGCPPPWTGLDDLSSETSWLRQLVGDEVIYGTGTQQARRDGAQVITYALSLDGAAVTLPAAYARELRTSVLPAAKTPFAKSPEQLNTAANAAEKLNGELDAAC